MYFSYNRGDGSGNSRGINKVQKATQITNSQMEMYKYEIVHSPGRFTVVQ